MPELGSARPLHLVTDLHITLSSERGDAEAHLHGDSDSLILDVDHPAALLGQAAGRTRRQFPPPLRQLLTDTPVQIRSDGRVLARLRMTRRGRVRARPTGTGLLTVVKAAQPASWARPLAVAGAALAALTTTGLIRRHLRGRSA